MKAVGLHLFHAPSSRSARARWLLEELGADYKITVVIREERSGEPYRQQHPLGCVPALETDRGTLFETMALCLQIAETHPQAELLPSQGSFERAYAPAG